MTTAGSIGVDWENGDILESGSVNDIGSVINMKITSNVDGSALRMEAGSLGNIAAGGSKFADFNVNFTNVPISFVSEYPGALVSETLTISGAWVYDLINNPPNVINSHWIAMGT